MLNVIELNHSESQKCSSIKNILPIKKIFPKRILLKIELFRKNKIDNLIIRGLPVPENLPNTPIEIRKDPGNMFPAYILKNIGDVLGTRFTKKIKNTIRFRTSKGVVNEETWHSHRQYKYALVYCLRGDPRAKTHFLSINNLVKNASKKIRSALLAPYPYFQNRQAFSLVVKTPTGYEISDKIYHRSDFEKYIKHLDLPDVGKALKICANRTCSKEAQDAVNYLLNAIKNPTSYVVYKPGDIALYNEKSTMRFSPSYVPSTSTKKDRWMLSLSVYE